MAGRVADKEIILKIVLKVYVVSNVYSASPRLLTSAVVCHCVCSDCGGPSHSVTRRNYQLLGRITCTLDHSVATVTVHTAVAFGIVVAFAIFLVPC